MTLSVCILKFGNILQLFNCLLTIKNISVLQQIYQAILADRTSNFQCSFKFSTTKLIVIGIEILLSLIIRGFNEYATEAVFNLNCNALYQIENIKDNMIGIRY